MEDIKLEGIKNLPEDIENLKNDKPEDITISDDDYDRFFKSVVNDEPYYEDVKFFGGKMIATYRTRTLKETETVINEVAKIAPTTNAELETMLAKYYLAYSLVKITQENKSKEFDLGELKERLDRINFQGHKYMLLIKGLFDFEAKIEEMRNKASNVNF